MMRTRPRALVSAFACHPRPLSAHFPGEAVLGWALTREIAAFADVHLMTWSYNRVGLEGALADPSGRPVAIELVALPDRLHRALRDRHYGARFYYFLWQKRAAAAARRLAKGGGFDLFHQITFANDWMPSFVATALEVPFVWGPIGGGQRVPRPLRRVLSPRDRLRERSRTVLQSLWRRTPARRRTARRASVILVCNEETRKVLARYREKLIDFPVNGISKGDIAGERDSAAARGGPARRLLYVGRFDPIKGLPLALEALRLLSTSLPEATLELVGEGPERPRLERLAAELGVSGRLRWTPWSDRAEIFRMMRRSDVFLFPSLRDGGGAVVVEAMASGLPVVCLDSGGPGFHVQGAWGIKVPPGRPAAVATGMAEAALKLCRDPELRSSMGRAARERALSFYEWGRLGQRLERIYEEVLT